MRRGNACIAAILRLEAISKYKSRGAPIIEALRNLNALDSVHQHDVGTAGRDDHRRAVALLLRRKENGKERLVKRPRGGSQRDLARFPQFDVEILVAGVSGG